MAAALCKLPYTLSSLMVYDDSNNKAFPTVLNLTGSSTRHHTTMGALCNQPIGGLVI